MLNNKYVKMQGNPLAASEVLYTREALSLFRDMIQNPLKLMDFTSDPIKNPRRKGEMFCIPNNWSELAKYNLTCSILYFFPSNFSIQFHMQMCNYHLGTYSCTFRGICHVQTCRSFGYNLVMQTLIQQSPKALTPLLAYLNLDLNNLLMQDLLLVYFPFSIC